MTYVATLIANPNNPVLDQQLGEQAAKAIGTSQLYWLADGIACDIPLPSNTNCDQARQQISAIIANAPIDVTIQTVETRRKKALIADMDSTMIDQECIDELAVFAGVYDKVAAITIRTMNGELGFDTSMRERVAMLDGLDVSVITQVIEEKITLASGGKTLVKTMRDNGAYTALVSGGFTSFTAKIAEQIGFHENRANVLIEENGVLAGKVEEPILGLEKASGALVSGVVRDGPAEKSGVKSGDIILEFDGKVIDTMRDLPRIVAETSIDKVVDVLVLRQGKKETIKVTLGRLEDGEKKIASATKDEEKDKKTDPTVTVVGITVQALTDDIREAGKIGPEIVGVIITKVEAGSHAEEKGIKVGEIVVQVGQEPVLSAQDVADQVKRLSSEGRKNALLMVSSKTGDIRFVVVRIAG